MAADYLDRIARFASELRFDDLPAEVVERAERLLLDATAVTVAGAAEPRVRQAAAMLRKRGSQGRSLFATDGYRGDAADAALVNATASCAHVLDEGHKYARGHVGTYVIPAVVAVAEEREVSGRELITALVAGYEIAARMGMACRVRESMHPSGTWGTIGASAACARLMGFAPDAIRVAMNVAAPLTLATSWQAATQGATVRDLYSGQGAANAVMAPRWVEAGFTGSDDDVAHIFGHVSAERFDTDAACSELGQRWEVMRNYFKVHACCRNFQSGIDAVLRLREEHDVRAADIRSIRAETFAVPARDNAEPKPANVLAAKESFPVSLALTLVNGRCDQSVFTEARVADPEVARLAAACEVSCDPELDKLAPEKRPSRITLQMTDGRQLTALDLVALGDPSRPLSAAELDAKFDQLVAGRLGASPCQGLRQAIHALRDDAPLSPFTSAMTERERQP
ncbi:MmgE/PrpD family protein [Ramlibacter sp.]|uniref:MmgE/PrpD family protein n=1 Tax=Ramlibacter sp. TaxID=1917967 RepID=UPI003D09B0EB